jgi:hypothetical protein
VLAPVTYLGDLAKIPVQGPLVVVANHPFGAIEGIIAGSLLLNIRTDVRILGNYLHLVEAGKRAGDISCWRGCQLSTHQGARRRTSVDITYRCDCLTF